MEKIISIEKKTFRDLWQENCDDEVLILKDITRTYPDLQLFEKRSLNTKIENDPFDYVFFFNRIHKFVIF